MEKRRVFDDKNRESPSQNLREKGLQSNEDEMRLANLAYQALFHIHNRSISTLSFNILMYRTPRSLSPRKSNPDLLSITSDKPPAGLPLREALKQAQQHSHYSRATRMFQQEATIIPATAASVPAPTSICPTELEWQRTATIPILPTLETPQESQINIRTCKDTRKMVDDSSHALPQPWSMFHFPATAASSPSCSSECDSEDGDADGDSFASFFQSFPNESSVSTPTLISVEAPETARQGEDSHLPVEESVSVFPVKRKIKVKDEDSKDTSSSSTSSKKSTSKVS